MVQKGERGEESTYPNVGQSDDKDEVEKLVEMRDMALFNNDNVAVRIIVLLWVQRQHISSERERGRGGMRMRRLKR